jgi:hypothetical protein
VPAAATKQRTVDPNAELIKRLGSRWWRMNHLYHVTDKHGQIVRFQPNAAQTAFYRQMHYLNCILKARQLGFSTFIAMSMLDSALFAPNTRCGIIDATLDDARQKLGKIRLAYEMLPDQLKAAIPIETQNSTEITWTNGSAIRVGTSHRGGTFQILHVSEFGKICARTPDKAREIVAGAFNTAAPGSIIHVESTAAGPDGRFYDLCTLAQENARRGMTLSQLDWKFFFYPWWTDPTYVLDDPSVPIPDELHGYFTGLEREGIRLTLPQKRWYTLKRAQQHEDMWSEFPSTADEAFKSSVEGSIFGRQMDAAEIEGRVGDYPAWPGIPVSTSWDIGVRDYTSCFFFQVKPGKIRVLGYYQNVNEGIPHYAAYCQRLFERKGWIKGVDLMPHDAKVREWGSSRSRIEQLVDAGFKPIVAQQLDLHDGINAVRAVLPICEFNEPDTREARRILRSYRWDWDDIRGAWKTGKPRHDEASHGADAFRVLAVAWRDIPPTVASTPSRIPESFRRDQELDVIDLMREEGHSMTDAIRRIIEEKQRRSWT